eukprot:5309346-Prymnesium_polylepis.1
MAGGHGLSGRGAHLAGVRAAARRPRGTHRPGQVLPALHRGGVQERDAAHVRARDPAHQSGQHRAADEGDGRQRPAPL